MIFPTRKVSGAAVRIITVRMPANGKTGIRIRATAQGKVVTIPYPTELPSDEAHRVAARQLLTVLGGSGPLRITHKTRRGFTFHTQEG